MSMASQYRAAVGDFVTNVEIEGAAKAASKGTRFSKAKDLTKRLRGWTPWVGDTAVFDARLLSALPPTLPASLVLGAGPGPVPVI